MALRIARRVLDEIADHARRSAPQECCGILLAVPPGAAVTSVLRAENAETERPTERYLLDHHTQLRALDLEIQSAADIVGYYHSHPTGGIIPSAYDVEHSVPDTVYLICGLAGSGAAFAAWQRTESELLPCPLEVLDGNPNQG